MINLPSELENVRTVAIAGHVKPDGDCIGSCLGMYLYLTTCFPDVQTDVFLGKIAPEYGFLKGGDQIRHCLLYTSTARDAEFYVGTFAGKNFRF